ncbi:MAG: FKBP-type peptidyl-prolyl cis-trans isomerase [Bacteroidetes bacterium]|nr:FKBP-type peptidyl-prolyl cis-trans isomerase [Bacteroidota bacterium]
MNNRQIITLIVVAVATLAAGYFIGSSTSGVKSENQISLKNQNDSLNYFLGLNMGYSLGQAPWDVNAGLVSSGITQVMDDSSMFDQMTADAIFRQLNVALSEVEAKKAESASLDNLEKGAAFLAENGKRKGVITTESGLQYEIITKGDGPMPTETSQVTVHYEGTLMDGEVFDSSYDAGEPVSFGLNGVIPGWTEGLQLMPVGSTYKFYVPSTLGYGPRGTGPIPGNSTLIFKVELLEIAE